MKDVQTYFAFEDKTRGKHNLEIFIHPSVGFLKMVFYSLVLPFCISFKQILLNVKVWPVVG